MIFFKVNPENRVYFTFTSDNEVEPDAYPLTKEINPDDKNVMWALFDNSQLIFDEEYDLYHNPPLTKPNYTEDEATYAIQMHLDDTARRYAYDSMLSASTYINSTVPRFKNEAIALTNWRDEVWVWAYNLLAEIEAGSTTAPLTIDALVSMIPKFVPPAS